VEAFEDEKKLEKMEDPINMLQAMSLLRKVAPEVFSKKIIQIGNLSDVDLVFEPYAKELSILEAMENFLANQHHLVHRLGVFDPHGEIHRIISQSDIIKFLQMKNEQGVFKELSRLTVQDCGFCSSERALGLCCVEPHELTINVLKKLRDRDISCVGVVYEDVLIANFSASDLRRVTKDHVSILGLPIAEFLALSHRTSYGGYSHIESQHVSHAFFQKMNEDSPTAVDRRDKAIEKDEIFLQTVGVSATISDVLNALTYVHRVWVVVEKPKLNAGKPLDVITLTDVLRLFISEENDAFGEENK
jgi:CBS domain-containing protein